MDTHTFTTVITPEYAARRDALTTTVPAAHNFLVQLESLCAEGTGFHLGTAQNVHVYDGERFLLYVRIERKGAGRTTIVLSSTPHQQQVKAGTRTDAAPTLMRRLVLIAMDQRGFHNWVEKEGDTLVLAPNAPSAFYDAVVVALRTR